MDVVKGEPEGGSESIPVWVYGAVAGGVVFLGGTLAVAGNWLWRRNKKRMALERNAGFKADYIENMTPREEQKKE
jgi:hypothetical protein